MESLEYIDNYFKGELDSEETVRFEEKIINDSAFAEEVAHYLSFLQVAKEQADEDKKKRFRELYQQDKNVNTRGVLRRIWPTVAVAALVAGVIFGWYLFMQPVSAKQLADRYMQEHFQTMIVKMDAKTDSMQSARNLYNEGKLLQALKHFEMLIQADTSNFEAKENAGLRLLFRRRTCRRRRQYETAPRRQRSQSPRDDAHWFACAAGIHDHHGSLQLFLRSQADLSAPIERTSGGRSCQS